MAYNLEYEFDTNSRPHAIELSTYMLRIAALAVNNGLPYKFEYYLKNNNPIYQITISKPNTNPNTNNTDCYFASEKALEAAYNKLIEKMAGKAKKSERTIIIKSVLHEEDSMKPKTTSLEHLDF